MTGTADVAALAVYLCKTSPLMRRRIKTARCRARASGSRSFYILPLCDCLQRISNNQVGCEAQKENGEIPNPNTTLIFNNSGNGHFRGHKRTQAEFLYTEISSGLPLAVLPEMSRFLPAARSTCDLVHVNGRRVWPVLQVTHVLHVFMFHFRPCS
ncbi:hypothetical protein EVAR_51004_1 [Eumeta japonica]|uniref:Uncharacterized protein n=1 Tax=Eumeta variegata TaxID=151549 RepID=A0A4C1ZXV2_EUMVA|nr:hypothetical protein EVAR_51004_1 [Eumeta japonica]